MSPSSNQPSRSILVVGDAVALALFALIGRSSHSMDNSLAAVARTALPFAMAWFLVAALSGAYGPDATATPKRAALTAARTWLIAFPLGLLLRSLLLGRIPHWSFALVAGAFLLVALPGWRTVLAALRTPSRGTR